MISAFFILNQRGEVLISRLFRPDLKSVPLSLSLSLPYWPPPTHTYYSQTDDLYQTYSEFTSLLHRLLPLHL